MMEGLDMALNCDVELESGITIPNAYLRIGSFSGNENYISFNLNIYVDKDAYIEEKPSVSTVSHSMKFDTTSNLFRQMYEHLRTLPQYINAVEA